tara:strand:- start:154 stop:342 length:189 start_codon:yes stop_codon:yes gene_type:complete
VEKQGRYVEEQGGYRKENDKERIIGDEKYGTLHGSREEGEGDEGIRYIQWESGIEYGDVCDS